MYLTPMGKLKDYHKLLHEALDDGSMDPEQAGWGEKLGNLLAIPLEQLEPCDGLVAGPPCQPWAHNGKRLGKADPRAKVYEKICEWIVHFAQGDFLFFALENSTSIAVKQGDEEEAYMLEVTAKLEQALPTWVIEISFSRLEPFIPHKRGRCWLRGMRRDKLDGSLAIPAPLPCFGEGAAPLEDFLLCGLPNITIESMSTSSRRANKQCIC